jgi:hypothetical protein
MRTGELIAQRFSLEHLAGRGGMGEVYRAKDVSSGETVALKLLRGDAGADTQRFLREARVLSQLDHPAIVRHVAHGVTDSGELFLAMRWLDGEDLASRLERGPLSVPETLAVAERACHALSTAHASGVVHRDLKPHNLFLEGKAPSAATLLDFGIARVDSTRAKTRTGAMLGTPAYMSPEQARGERAVDERCDVWALGAVLFECLTGQPPFTGDHIMAILAKVLFEPAPQLSDVLPEAPAGLSALIGRMLTRTVESRPRNMAEVLAALRAVQLPEGGAPEAKALKLGGGELRRLFVVLAAPARRLPAPLERTASPGLSSTQPSAARLELPWAVREKLAKDHRAQIEALIDGSVVAAMSSEGSAVDAAARAARCALALREALPEAGLAVATGRGVVSGALPVGDVIDRAARLLLKTSSGAALHVDEGTAALLEGRFEVERDGETWALREEKRAPETVRTLLGRPTPCIGRDRELATLNGVLAECINEPGARAVLVTAPPGTGKSRLRFELVGQIVRDAKARVWLARGDPTSAGSAFGMLRQLLQQAAGIESGDGPDVARARITERVQACVAKEMTARVAAFLGELVGAPFEANLVEVRAARANAALMADQTRRALEEWLKGECAAAPVVLVLEDLHWGDGATVAHLDHALEALRDLPLMVLALARPEVKEVLGPVWAARGVVELPLHELSKKSCERLARQVLEDKATPDTVERIAALAQGNAFYLEELIRAVAEGRGATLPESVLAMAQSRFETLEPQVRALLRAGSVFGDRFWKEPALALASVDEGSLSAAVERELVEVREGGRFKGHVELSFRHALLREAAYQALTEDDRRIAHRAAAEWLERAGETDAVVLAGHWNKANELEKAAAGYHRAAAQALEAGDFAAAKERVRLALECGLSGEARTAAELIEVEALRWGGDQLAFFHRGGPLLPRLQPGTPQWLSLLADLVVMSWRVEGYRPEDILEKGKLLLEVAVEPSTTAAFVRAGARIFSQAAIALIHNGLESLANRVEELASRPELEDASVQAWVEQMRGFRSAAARDLLAAGQHLETSARLFESIGDHRNAIAERLDCCFIYLECGQLDRLAAMSAVVVSACRELGLSRLLYLARVIGLYGRSQTEPAHAVLEEARAAVAELPPSHSHFITGIVLLAEMELAAGDPEAALASATRGEAVTELMEYHFPESTAAHALLALGRPEEALRHLEGRQGKRAVLTDVAGGFARYDLARARVLDALGRHDEARKVLAGARDELVAASRGLKDPEVQKSFLTNLRDRAELLALAKQWGV